MLKDLLQTAKVKNRRLRTVTLYLRNLFFVYILCSSISPAESLLRSVDVQNYQNGTYKYCRIYFISIPATDWTVPLYGAVLLTGGCGASGTLAVNGIGSLSESPFSLATGDVACRQMGYRGACVANKGSL